MNGRSGNLYLIRNVSGERLQKKSNGTAPVTGCSRAKTRRFTAGLKAGVLNSCYNALDYHVENGLKNGIALIYDSPVTKTVKRYTYGELRDLVARCAGGLRQLGVGKGDRVVIYMPMIPEAVIAMLACARIGAIHSVVFGGFAARELATRIEDAKPRVVISASCGIEVNRIIPYQPLLESAIDMCDFKPSTCVIVQRPESPAILRDGQGYPLGCTSGCRTCRLCSSACNRSALSPVHFRHHGKTQRCDAG